MTGKTVLVTGSTSGSAPSLARYMVGPGNQDFTHARSDSGTGDARRTRFGHVSRNRAADGVQGHPSNRLMIGRTQAG